MLSEAQKRELDEVGYLVIESYMGDALLGEVRKRVDELFEREGAMSGSEFKQEPGARRLANLVDKGEVFAQCISMPEVLDATSHVLGPEFKLSSLNVRATNPNSDDAQPLHCDMAAIADDRGYWVSNTLWMLDDFTRDNGPLRVVPGSHRWNRLPQDVLDDPRAPHPEEILVLGPAGTIVVCNAHVWHGGTANHTAKPRRAMHSFFCRQDKPQQQYQKKMLSPTTQAALTPQLRKLLALDDPLNDELSSADVVRSGFMK